LSANIQFQQILGFNETSKRITKQYCSVTAAKSKALLLYEMQIAYR